MANTTASSTCSRTPRIITHKQSYRILCDGDKQSFASKPTKNRRAKCDRENDLRLKVANETALQVLAGWV
jgi:hypothetical protein